MRTVAIIPARGGSKGIPAKNLQAIGGVPLVGWAVRAALGARSIAAVYVSTDSERIARVAREYGAQVIVRPAELARDETPTLPVVRHAIDQFAEQPDAVAILQCTSPLTISEDVDCAVGLLDQHDSVVSVVEDHGYLVSREGLPLNHSADDRRRRRQDREVQYRLNGALFVLRCPLPDEWPDRCGLYIMPPERSIDIDHPVDLHLAEALLRYTQAWIVCGSGPDAREMLAEARRRYPHARTITTNQGIELFPAPDRPDVYWLSDMHACQIYHDQAMAAQARGTRLVTMRREPRALRERRLDRFDQFVPGGSGGAYNQFVRGAYTAGLSGLLCLSYAIHHGARQIHLVGMNGYTGQAGEDYFAGHEPGNPGPGRQSHTAAIIEPFVQQAANGCPDIDYILYGRLNWRASGANVRPAAPGEEPVACA